ncbi:S8 family serine peptidase [Solibaculum mannosilyticum]|uniref:S8 family serine peptidase n=1 Tax=Solibaculum mannosilyticum TaxID=2780922 RepID=UPI0034BA5D94
MKRILKRISIFIISLLLLFALFLVVWIFLIFPHFIATDNKFTETQPSFSKIAEESEKIDFNESNGIPYVNNEVVVFIKQSATSEEIETLFHNFEADVEESMADICVYKLIFNDAMSYDDLESLIKELKANSIVDNAYLNTITEFDLDAIDEEGDFEYQNPSYPDDPWNHDTWNVDVPNGENWGMEAINAPGAWGYLSQLNDVKIGLIDTMPDTSHEDLTFSNSNCSCLFIDENTGEITTNKYALSADDHGTHVSGIMAAKWNNKTGVSGVMGDKGELYYCEVYYDSKGKISSYATAYSYLLALKTLIDQDVQVINISQHTNRLIGFAASHGNQNAINYLSMQADLTEKGLLRIISKREDANKPDFVICVSAGNSNHIYYYKDNKEPYGYRSEITIWERIKYFFGWRGEIGDSQALYNNFLNLMDADEVKNRVIVVGAIGIDSEMSTPNNTRYSYAYFSNVGARVDIVAPGVDIYSCTVNGYDFLDGTSMATPHVSGVAGLIFACNPSLSGPDVKNILLSSTTGRFYHGGEYSGLLNANNSVINAIKTKEIPIKKVLKTNVENGLDLCFVVDTTGSMEDDIDNAKENMESILESLSEKTKNYRVALIDYRDFASRSNNSSDYAYKVQLKFTDNDESITDAIDDLDLGNGGDNEETVYSALMAAVNLDWRSDAKKVIIILGDAAPLDPEPTTNYTYDDVLLALFNADVSIDYENSDDRVVDMLDSSLINVFSIGANASTDAADFFKKISDSTGGNYASVDDASDVSDAIIGSIEQINVVEKFTVDADFGDGMANQTVNLYSEEGFFFTFETDDRGHFTIDSIEADTYKWTSNNLYGGGFIDIEPNERNATVRTTMDYWFTPILSIWHRYNLLIYLMLIVYIMICFMIPLTMKKNRKKCDHKTKSVSKKSTEHTCQRCGNICNIDERYCGKCGSKLT